MVLSGEHFLAVVARPANRLGTPNRFGTSMGKSVADRRLRITSEMIPERESIATALGHGDSLLTRLIFLHLWPFWLFRDASHGNLLARAAAYRHNRSARVYLPRYLMKLSFGSAMLLALTFKFQAFSAQMPQYNGCFLWIAAGFGMAFACTISMLLSTTYIYLCLSQNDH